jgi:hypothetical protein
MMWAASAPAKSGDEQHRDEEQAAAEEGGREEPVLAVADQVRTAALNHRKAMPEKGPR